MVNIFLAISYNMCFGCSKEPSNWDSSLEYQQHMFWLKNKKTNFQLGQIKKISVFRVMGLKFLSRVGTRFFLLEKKQFYAF